MFRRRSARDFRAEIEAHVQHEADRLRTLGMNDIDALAAARRSFGNITRAEEDFAEARRWRWPGQLAQDLRFGARMLRRDAGVSAMAVVTLALGLAVNASMFSLVNAFVLWRPPVPDADRVVVVSAVEPAGDFLPDVTPVSAPTFLAWRHTIPEFSQAAAFGSRSVNVTIDGATDEFRGKVATANFFRLLGITPALGRTFAPDEDQAGHADVVVLSHDVWQRRFNADPSAVGRDIRIDRRVVHVIGVLPGDFRLLGYSADLWMPLELGAADASVSGRSRRWLTMVARLGPTATPASAREAIDAAAHRAEVEFPASEKGWRASVRTLPDFLVYAFHARDGLAVMSAAASLILLLGCANVAGLLIARGAGREREIAIRRSLGAGPWRIAQQLLTESLILAAVGCAAGWILTTWGVQFLATRLSANAEIEAIHVGLDWHVFAFSLVLAALAAVACGVAPAFQAVRTDAGPRVSTTSRGASASRAHSRMRLAIVTGEIAVALCLLIGAGLLARALYLVERQQLGFDPHPLLTARVTLDHARYDQNDKVFAFTRDFLARVGSVPGVDAVAVASDLPSTGTSSVRFQIEGQGPAVGAAPSAAAAAVSPSFFRTAGVPLMQGRLLADADTAPAARVVLVNEAFAKRYLSNRSAVGTRLRLRVDGAAATAEVVGVVGNVKTYSEDNGFEPEIFETVAQRPLVSMAVLVRTASAPASFASFLRGALAEIDPDLPLSRIMTMDDVLQRQNATDGLFMSVLVCFAVFALLLSGIGVYGLVAFSVGQRRREIGIRVALGASSADVLRAILRQSAIAAAIGTVVGLAMALPLPSMFDSMFTGLVLHEPQIYVVVPLILAALTLLATVIPARRALRVNPTETLRDD